MARCCQYSDLKPGGGFRAFHRVLVYLCGESGTEPSVTPRSGWSPLTDRWCIGRLIRKRPLHSSAYRLILQWGRALRFDTARAVAVHRSSGRAISHPLIVRQVCCKRSCPGCPVCRKRRSQSFLWPFALKCFSTYSILHRPQNLRFSSVHAISQLLLQYKSVVRLFCFFF